MVKAKMYGTIKKIVGERITLESAKTIGNKTISVTLPVKYPSIIDEALNHLYGAIEIEVYKGMITSLKGV